MQCDAEIGRPGNWRGCKRRAVVQMLANSGMLLNYCDKHKHHAETTTANQHNSGRAPGSTVMVIS